jgi:cysteinyl-tRNA synthetase
MEEHEMKKLATVIVDMMMAKQAEYDKEFKADIEDMMLGNPNVVLEVTDQDDQVREAIQNLEEDLAIYLAAEDYMKAATVKDKI